ncbi:MAG TPA: type II CAAX endopeptidase family protein [Acidimicrobiia bacterium]
MIREFTNRYPLAAFIVLACVFSWWLVPMTGYPLGSGPLFVALVVLGLTQGRDGLVGLGKQAARWRVSWKWYAVAVLLPAFAAVVAALLTVQLGAPSPSSAELAAWTEVPFTFLLVLMVPMFGPWEEPGFRGFALSELMRRRSTLVAGLTVGVIHVFWHLPLFFTDGIPMADVVYILGASVVFAWVVTGSGGSVLMAMLMRASSNAVSGEYISTMFTGSNADTLGWIRAGDLGGVWCWGRPGGRQRLEERPGRRAIGGGNSTAASSRPSDRLAGHTWRRDDIDNTYP